MEFLLCDVRVCGVRTLRVVRERGMCTGVECYS